MPEPEFLKQYVRPELYGYENFFHYISIVVGVP